MKQSRILIGIILCVILTVCVAYGLKKEDTLLWEIPINTEQENAVTYIAHYGYWCYPLGLYSYTATETIAFVDDSFNHRIMIYYGDGSHDSIVVDEKDFLDEPVITEEQRFVWTKMQYVESDNILYLLGYNIDMVEPKLWYCKVNLEEGKVIEAINQLEGPINRYLLDNNGQVATALNTGEVDKQIENELIPMDEGIQKFFFMPQAFVDASLIGLITYDGPGMIVCAVDEEKELSYSERIELVGDVDLGIEEVSSYYKGEQNYLTYMKQIDEKTVGIYGSSWIDVGQNPRIISVYAD